MAKTSGIIKIEGTVEDLTFYKKDGKNYVRKKIHSSFQEFVRETEIIFLILQY